MGKHNQRVNPPVLRRRRRLLFAAAASVMAGCGGTESASAPMVGSPGPTPSPGPSPPPPASPPPPPVPPPTGSTIVNLQLTSATGGTALPFTVGQAFRRGDVASGAFVAASAPELVSIGANVRNRWPDGSVKFAVLSGTITLAAGQSAVVAIQSSSAAPIGTAVSLADLRATGVTADIQFGAVRVSWSAADWVSPHRTIQSDSAMSSWTFRKPVGADTHLVAWLEVRCYKGGSVEVLPWIENGYLTVAGPGAKSGRATFTLGGTLRYDSINDAGIGTVNASGTLTIYHHARAVLIRNNVISYWLGAAPQIQPTHDRNYLRDTKFIPAYYPVNLDPSALSALTTHYSPGRICYTTGGMGNAGYAPDIGLLPNTSALYLISGDVRAYSAVLSTGFSLACYSIHYRDEATNRPLLFANHPNRSMATGNGLPAPDGNGSVLYASSHHPSAAYLPYLLTGWDWFLEEMQFQTTGHYLSRNQVYRRNANFFIVASAWGWNHNENGGVRAIAWTFRTLAMTAALTPDADTTMRNQFVTAINYNASEWRAQMQSGPFANALGFYNIFPPSPTPASGTWMNGFLAASVGLTWDLEVATGAGRDNLLWFRDFNYRMFAGLLGRPGVSSEYCFTRAANYAALAFADANGNWLTTWGDVWTRSYGFGNTNPNQDNNTLTGGNIGDLEGLSTSYWGNIQPAIAYAVDHGAPDALAGYNRMINSTNWATRVPGFNLVPVWAIKPRSV